MVKGIEIDDFDRKILFILMWNVKKLYIDIVK